jgi:type IV secretory pathway VirB4 component
MIFDTSKVTEPRLQKIATALLIDLIERKAAEYRFRAIRFTTIVDDAGDVMRSHAITRRLEELSRQARSCGLMLVCVTQKLGDFCRHKDEAGAIVRLCNTKLIFRPESRELNLLKEVFSLTTAEFENAKRLIPDQISEFSSDCVFIIGAQSEIIRLPWSPAEYWISTTEPIHDKPRRSAMINDIRMSNPNLSQLEVRREAIYKLSLDERV